MPVRGRLLGVALAVAACGSGSSPAAPGETPQPPGAQDTLKAAAADRGRLIGTAVQAGLLTNPQYGGAVEREFNYLTAEYQMKWNAIESSRGARNFAPGDAIVDYARSRGMRVKGHTFIWHESTPAWTNDLATEDFRAAVEQHIRSVAEHFRGRVHAWDVVNEAVADTGPALRDTVFRRKLGEAYIAFAFRVAREADPEALLFYNDYGGEGLNAKSERIYQLVRDLKASGVPIDGIGLQMHISAAGRPPDAEIAANMSRLAALGLIVHISEMDVRINNVAGSDQARLDAQRGTYHDVVAVCRQEPRCEAVTFWGFTDAHTWISGDRPLLFDSQYRPKPAYYGVLDALRGR